MDKLMEQILTTVADGYDSVRQGAGDCVRAKIEEQESAMTVHDLGLIRRAILSVIDDGPAQDQFWHWQLYARPSQILDASLPQAEAVNRQTEAEVSEQRLRFCDAIQNYVTDRLAPALKGKGEHA